MKHGGKNTSKTSAQRVRVLGLSVACLLLTTVTSRGETSEALPEVTVGMTARLEQLVLPGSELEVVPRDDDHQPLVVRIDQVFPHGTDFRYDLVYYALEPGEYDLREVLRRKDGSSRDDLPPLPLRVATSIEPGQVEPHALEMKGSPRIGGYRTWMILGGIAWALGLVGILAWRHRSPDDARLAEVQSLTVAERLRPYVQDAMHNRLSPERRAELEMLLLSYWRQELELETLRPADSLRRMKAHPEAGELLRALEDWLHRPTPPDSVDIASLLKPYQ